MNSVVDFRAGLERLSFDTKTARDIKVLRPRLRLQKNRLKTSTSVQLNSVDHQLGNVFSLFRQIYLKHR